MIYNVKNINTSYGNTQILHNVSFDFEEGKITAIIGENGSGKSTLIKSLCNLIEHTGSFTADNIKLDDLSVKELSRYIGYIPQRSGIEIDISVLEVVLMGFNPILKTFDSYTRDMIIKATDTLKLVGINDPDKNYLDLSEGQKQLCLLARALVNEPPLLIFDEPESALDFNWRYELFELIKKLNKTALIVLHDVDLSLNYADKIVLLHNGKNIDEIHPLKDSSKRIEEALNTIYNNVKVGEYKNDNRTIRHIYR